ncbi:unnamed protein product [Closterium sp. NIES-54]
MARAQEGILKHMLRMMELCHATPAALPPHAYLHHHSPATSTPPVPGTSNAQAHGPRTGRHPEAHATNDGALPRAKPSLSNFASVPNPASLSVCLPPITTTPNPTPPGSSDAHAHGTSPRRHSKAHAAHDGALPRAQRHRGMCIDLPPSPLPSALPTPGTSDAQAHGARTGWNPEAHAANDGALPRARVCLRRHSRGWQAGWGQLRQPPSLVEGQGSVRQERAGSSGQV